MLEIESTSELTSAQFPGFVRHLREVGLTVGTNQFLAWMNALKVVGWQDLATFFQVAETTLLNQAEDRTAFRKAFVEYWLQKEDFAAPAAIAKMAEPDPGSKEGEASQVWLEVVRQERKEPVSPEAATAKSGLYSAREVLRRKNFASMTDDERRQVEVFLINFQFNIASYQTRRYQVGKGDRLDLRASIRKNMRYGGEWLRWSNRKRKQSRRSLVVLADISGSMRLHSRMLLLFIHGLVRGYQANVEAFLFGTRLTRITQILNAHPGGRFLKLIGSQVTDWSGGTRIGRSLETFHYDWGRRVLNRGPVVILISDGWDQGDPDILARAIARLQRSSASLIWLNPWLGSKSYQPKTRGMQVSLPFIDHFLPAHNLESLQAMAALLGDISMERREGQTGFAPQSMRSQAA